MPASIYYYKKKGISYNITDGGGGYLGLKHTEEWKEKLRKRNIGNKYAAHPCSKETKRKIAKKNGKAVEMFDVLTNETITIYESCHAAGESLNITFQGISKACLTGKSYKGFYFRYK